MTMDDWCMWCIRTPGPTLRRRRRVAYRITASSALTLTPRRGAEMTRVCRRHLADAVDHHAARGGHTVTFTRDGDGS